MHPEILTEEQRKLLSLVKKFSRSYYLVGGTAIALIIGHRRSVDFDLFTLKPIRFSVISKMIAHFEPKRVRFIFKDIDQVHYTVRDVKFTFFQFQFPIKATLPFDSVIKLPDLLTLGAMKAFALGGRGKWRDYVDLFFIMKYHHRIQEIEKKASELFGDFFNERLFREQLTFFSGLEYDTTIEYLKSSPSEEEIKSFLTEVATQPF